MPQTVQHRRRLGTPGAPPTLLQGQLAINDPGGGGLPFLYGGGASGVVTLVSNARQVELTGTQTISGDKTIDVGKLHLLGGASGDALVTDGLGNLQWATGEFIFPEAPADGLIYGRDGLHQSWQAVIPASGGTFTGTVNFTAGVEINGIGLVADAPADGRLYVRGNESWIVIPIGTLTGSGTGGGLPEAPNAPGVLYGRSGASQSWLPTLPLSGGSMLGNLILDGPPSSASPLNQAATKGYVDGLITGALQFIGTMNGTTGNVTYTTSSGFTNGPLIPATSATDKYVIASVAGTVPSGPISGQVLAVGDWIISDGTQWSVINIASMTIMASQVALSPTVFGQTDVQGALEFLAEGGLGQPAWTHTGADFTEPSVGGAVTVTVDNTDWMAVGAPLYIDGETYTVANVINHTSVQLTRMS